MKGLVLLFVVCLAAIVTVVAASSKVSPTFLFRKAEGGVVKPVPPNDSCVPHDGESPVVIPLESDSNDIFTMGLWVNDEYVKVAIDTGSEALVVASSDCSGCNVTADMKSIVLTKPSNTRSKLRYGSQKDEVVWQNNTNVVIQGWKFSCSDKDDAALTTYDDPKHRSVCVYGISDVAVVVKRTGTSDYNILGLGSQASGGPPSFLAKMFPTPPRAFAMHIHSPRHARLLLFKPDVTCMKPKHKVPINTQDYRSHHYYIRFKTIAANGTRIDTRVEKLLLDTGSNAVVLPSSVYRELKRIGRRGTLSFSLNDTEGKSFDISFGYDMDDTENSQILDAGYQNGDGDQRVIVGVTSLVGYAIGVYDDDVERFVTIDTIDTI